MKSKIDHRLNYTWYGWAVYGWRTISLRDPPCYGRHVSLWVPDVIYTFLTVVTDSQKLKSDSLTQGCRVAQGWGPWGGHIGNCSLLSTGT